MVGQREAIEGVDGRVLLVAYEQKEVLQTKMMHGLSIPYPLVFDLSKQSYQRWGMGRTTLLKSVFSPSLTLRYVKLLLRGERFLGLAGDMLQLGGDFVLDRRGRIYFAHRMRDNGDRAPVRLLMDKLREAAEA